MYEYEPSKLNYSQLSLTISSTGFLIYSPGASGGAECRGSRRTGTRPRAFRWSAEWRSGLLVARVAGFRAGFRVQDFVRNPGLGSVLTLLFVITGSF